MKKLSLFIITIILLSSCFITQKDMFEMKETCTSYETALKQECNLYNCSIESIFYSPKTNSCLYREYNDYEKDGAIIINLNLKEIGTKRIIKSYSAIADGEESDELHEFNEFVESYR